MDLTTVREVVRARSREDLSSIDGSTMIVAGGTWVFSEPQEGVSRLVDLSALGWTPLTIDDRGLEIAATCSVSRLHTEVWPARWPDLPALVDLCAESLLASVKVQRTATVGGNIALGLPAGSMTTLAAGLDAEALVWTPDGGERRTAVADLVTGPQQTSLRTGEVLRSIRIDERALGARIACRRMSLAPRGRSGSVVVGRVDADGSFCLTVTAATTCPVQLRAPALPTPSEVPGWISDTVPTSAWFDDVHGAPDWRRHVTGVLARQICEELA